MGANEASGSATRLELFGGPRIRASGTSVSLSPNQELLVTLVWGHEGAGLTRRRAIGLLWEEVDDARSRQRLRQLLHELRRRLGFDVVDAGDEDLIRPCRTGISSDLDTFRKALTDGDLRQALSVQRSQFGERLRRLPGEAFEDWLEAKRARLRRELREAAATRWDHAHPARRWDVVREAAEVLYALDPTSEQTVRMVIEARGMTGGVEAADAAYVSFLETLEAGARTDPKTIETVERVRRMAGTTSRRRDGSVGARDDAPLPLIGRGTELDAALAALDRIRAGDFEFVLLKGDAGVGKTRLLDEIVREAHLRGFRCLRAGPAELEQRIPLNPLVDALDTPEVRSHVYALDNPWKAVVSAVLQLRDPDGEPLPLPPVQESSLSRRLYEAFSILFSRMAGADPTLLVIDDIQWADATTVAVLQFVQRRWRGGPFGVVAAVRPEPRSDPEGVARYLDPRGDLVVTPIELRDLAIADASHLVSTVAHEQLDPTTVRQLTDLGGCNPFYLVELTRDYLAGQLQMPEHPGGEVTIPISLRQLVESRIERLSDDGVRAASVMATWGSPMKLADLAAVLQTDLDRCVDVVEELAAWRLVSQEADAVRFAHALFRSACYRRLNEARRVILHQAVAERLLTREPPPHDELAIHFARSGDAAQAAHFGRLAAATAMENGAFAEAAYFHEVVVENEADPHDKAEATAALAKLLHMKREIGRANPLLELAAARLRAVGEPAAALRIDIRRVEGLAEVGETPLADLLARLGAIKMSARVTYDWPALAFALDAELHLLHRSGRTEAIHRLFAEMKECAAKPDRVAAAVANASLALNVLFGNSDDGLRHATTAVQLAEEATDVGTLLLSLNRLVVVHAFRGELYLPGPRAVLDRAAHLAEFSGDMALRFNLTSNPGVFMVGAGDLDAAEVAFDRAAELLVGTQSHLLRFVHWCARGELALEQADFERSRSYFEEAEAVVRPTLPPRYQALATAGIGLSALEAGSIAEARRREAELPSDPPSWYFDPIIILAFRARLLERRREAKAAVRLLRESAAQLSTRFPTAFVRAEIMAAQMARRAGLHPDHRTLRKALSVARTLRLSTRAAQLEEATA